MCCHVRACNSAVTDSSNVCNTHAETVQLHSTCPQLRRHCDSPWRCMTQLFPQGGPGGTKDTTSGREAYIVLPVARRLRTPTWRAQPKTLHPEATIGVSASWLCWSSATDPWLFNVEDVEVRRLDLLSLVQVDRHVTACAACVLRPSSSAAICRLDRLLQTIRSSAGHGCFAVWPLQVGIGGMCIHAHVPCVQGPISVMKEACRSEHGHVPACAQGPGAGGGGAAAGASASRGAGEHGALHSQEARDLPRPDGARHQVRRDAPARGARAAGTPPRSDHPGITDVGFEAPPFRSFSAHLGLTTPGFRGWGPVRQAPLMIM